MERQVLPNRKLIRDLFEDYYLQGNTPQTLVSSHWKYYSEGFNVQVDNEGNVISLHGTGFGDMVSGSILTRIPSYVCHMSYFIRLPYKRDLLRLIMTAISICRSMGAYFSFDCFKQVCSLSLIRRNLTDNMRRKRLTFLVIGDGYGFLSCLIKASFPNSTIVLVDLGKTLLFQAFYCQKAHPGCSHYGIIKREMDNEIKLTECDFVYCPTEYLDRVKTLNYDISINIASMQEMNPPTIEMYFNFIRDYSNVENLFYCCNREKKVLRGGEVIEYHKYPWSQRDRHLVDELCPWYKYFFSLSSTRNGPKLFSVRLPFINYFEGPIWHRLTWVATSKE